MLHRVQASTAREAGQSPQTSLIVGEEQLVAPTDGTGQRPSALRTAAAGVAQERESVIEAASNVTHRHGSCTGRRELDGEREPVKGSADLAHEDRGLVVERELLAQRLGTRGEQRDSVGLTQCRQVVHAFLVDAEPY